MLSDRDCVENPNADAEVAASILRQIYELRGFPPPNVIICDGLQTMMKEIVQLQSSSPRGVPGRHSPNVPHKLALRILELTTGHKNYKSFRGEVHGQTSNLMTMQQHYFKTELTHDLYSSLGSGRAFLKNIVCFDELNLWIRSKLGPRMAWAEDYDDPAGEEIKLWREFAANAFAFWFALETAVICRFPTRAVIDEHGRLNNILPEPALVFADGTELRFWRGRYVPKDRVIRVVPTVKEDLVAQALAAIPPAPTDENGVDVWYRALSGSQGTNQHAVRCAVNAMYALMDLPPPVVRFYQSPSAVGNAISVPTLSESFGTLAKELGCDCSGNLVLPPQWARRLGDPGAMALSILIQEQTNLGWMNGLSGCTGVNVNVVNRSVCTCGSPLTNIWRALCMELLAFSVSFDVFDAIERPVEVHVDDNGRYHNRTAPAVRFADGSRLYAFEGIRIPNQYIEDPETFTVSAIDDEPNAAVRAALIRLYDPGRYMIDSQAHLIDSSAYGELFVKEFQNGGESMVMVRVKNSTPEPDGTYRMYFLRVPPQMRTAREAVAWTFGFADPRQYKPSLET